MLLAHCDSGLPADSIGLLAKGSLATQWLATSHQLACHEVAGSVLPTAVTSLRYTRSSLSAPATIFP